MSRVVRRPRRSAVRPAVLTVVVVLVLAAAYLVAAAVVPFAPTTATKATYAAPTATVPALRFPAYGATAVQAPGFPDSLQTSGDADPRSIASISKVVTALVVLDQKPLTTTSDGPTITFTQEQHDLYATYLAQDGEVAQMPVGLQLTEKQAFQVMLMKSANNYAGSLALWAFGSMDRYRAAATTWLAAHDLDHTTIVEPTGLDPANTSTATDLVHLGELAIANPVVKQIVGTKTLSIPTVGQITNSNKLLGVDGVDGIKTGTLDEAGACLLFAATYQRGGHDVTVVGAMLGGATHDALDADIQALLHSVADNFHTVTLTNAGQSFASYATPWKASADAVSTSARTVLVWGRTTVSATTSLRTVTFGTRGERVGTVRFSIEHHDPVTVPLVLDRAIDDPGIWWRWTNPFQGS
ncbi:D-alanyl-D-alanine carboxypeptidase family protein [Curtobacterium sp. RRHDQ10]|uniref:D-alanyl-D-alanine carboxypeptidase family protein n=1 Tax=Curtobacterium phyllosphaerae TaxID=3413379 RepID=UPI003BEF54BD